MRVISSLIAVFLFFGAMGASADTRIKFSPNGGCLDAIVSEIAKAQKTIDIAMYYLTAREIAQELVKAKERGVAIRIVLDRSQEVQTYSKSRYLIQKGIDVRYYTGSGLMHNKFAVIDGKKLITGSFNWTASADGENEENLLVMTGKKLIAGYDDRFKYLWQKKSRKGELAPEDKKEK